ncbi:MAG: DUF5591 domain-containing protein, partial [Candidatus Odinarchaeia archaeon]
SLNRPEILRHTKQVVNLKLINNPEILIILPEPSKKPFKKSNIHKKFLKYINRDTELINNIQIITLSQFFGVVPLEIEEYYPLSQHLTVDELKLTQAQIQHIINVLTDFLKNHKFKKIIFVNDTKKYGDLIKDFLVKNKDIFNVELKILLKEEIVDQKIDEWLRNA